MSLTIDNQHGVTPAPNTLTVSATSAVSPTGEAGIAFTLEGDGGVIVGRNTVVDLVDALMTWLDAHPAPVLESSVEGSL